MKTDSIISSIKPMRECNSSLCRSYVSRCLVGKVQLSVFCKAKMYRQALEDTKGGEKNAKGSLPRTNFPIQLC